MKKNPKIIIIAVLLLCFVPILVLSIVLLRVYQIKVDAENKIESFAAELGLKKNDLMYSNLSSSSLFPTKYAVVRGYYYSGDIDSFRSTIKMVRNDDGSYLPGNMDGNSLFTTINFGRTRDRITVNDIETLPSLNIDPPQALRVFVDEVPLVISFFNIKDYENNIKYNGEEVKDNIVLFYYDLN